MRRVHTYAIPFLALFLLDSLARSSFVTGNEYQPLQSASRVIASAASGMSSDAVHYISLSGGLMHPAGFYFPVKVGGQSLKLQFDTSYSSIIVPGKRCQGCRIGDDRYDPAASTTAHLVSCDDKRCEPAKCSIIDGCHTCSDKGACCSSTSNGNTNQCAFNMLYRDHSSGNGSLYYDTIELPISDGRVKATVPIGVMHEESHTFERAYVDGTFGIAFEKGACHPGCTAPIMDHVRNQSGTGDMLTFCASAFGGTLGIGNVPGDKLATEPFTFLPVIDLSRNEYFVVQAMPYWNVGGYDVQLPGIAQALVSATTSSIGVGPGTMRELQVHFMQHYCEVPELCTFTSWFKPHRCVHMEESDFKKLPNITIPLTHMFNITISPDDYIPKYRIMKGKQYRCVAFHIAKNSAKRGIGLVIGASILRKYAAVFDRKQRRVGFAKANIGQCGPLNGTDQGLVGLAGAGLTANLPILTATTPQSNISPGLLKNSTLGKQLLHAETCRAQEGCRKCSRIPGCSYWYATGKCVVSGKSISLFYPYCKRPFCACWSVGAAGWYFGLGIGILAALALIVAVLLMYAKRQRRYQQLDVLDNQQDLETF